MASKNKKNKNQSPSRAAPNNDTSSSSSSSVVASVASPPGGPMIGHVNVTPQRQLAYSTPGTFGRRSLGSFLFRL
jgi:hypothetical protein